MFWVVFLPNRDLISRCDIIKQLVLNKQKNGAQCLKSPTFIDNPRCLTPHSMGAPRIISYEPSLLVSLVVPVRNCACVVVTIHS